VISPRDVFILSVRQVFRQKRRNFGVVLAIALGIAGLIAILSMGDEVKKNLNRDLDLLGGVTLIKVSLEEEQQPGARPEAFSDATMQEIAALPGVAVLSATAKEIQWLTILHDQNNIQLPVHAVDANYWSANNLDSVAGTLFSEQEVQDRERVCVLGSTLAESLGGENSVVGTYLPIGSDPYLVTGVVDGLQIGDRKRYSFVPLTTAMDRNPDNKIRINRLFVRCKTWDDVPVVAKAIPGCVAQHQSARFLKVEVAWDQLKRIITIVWWVELFIYLSIGATLVLGGFGIWNGMMSSVTARTREIGLKKAMGAEEADIMLQILCESVVLSFWAAVLGVSLGLLAVAATSHYLGSVPPHPVILRYSLISLVFSCLLGMVAGLYPSLRAARMDAVTAIRYE
jgi:putative ABC transport system permease protein